jgi:rhomboid protease GluP
MIDKSSLTTLFTTPYGIIIVICCVIALLPSLGFVSQDYIFGNFMKVNSAINAGEKWRLFTSIFLHADFFHLLFNMYSLFILGGAFMQVFDYLGKSPSLSFIIVFVVAGICGSLASYYFNPSNSLGASGAIFGLIGALFAVALIKGQTDMLMSYAYIIGLNLVFGFLPGSNLDNSGHIGGLLGGIGMGVLLLLI